MRFCLRGFGSRAASLSLAALLGLSVAVSAVSAAGLPREDTVSVNIVEPSDDSNTWTYDPSQVTVKLGDSVLWTNLGNDPHDITADDGTFVSGEEGNMFPGNTFQFTFSKAGNFGYYCKAHPWMRGTVVVQ